jgi:ubiquinone/menaquinone biosynthesis C-methylase UbiE
VSELHLAGTFTHLIQFILKSFLQLLYHQFAWAYDWVADIVSVGRWKTWVLTVRPYLENKQVLELGCGPGHLQTPYFAPGTIIFGLDASQQMLRRASHNLQANNRARNLIQANSLEVPLRDDAFQVVVATFPSNYIFDQKTLAEAWRVLQPGGQLLIMPAAWITGRSVLDRLAAWLFRITGEVPDFRPQTIQTTYSTFFERINQAGFHVEFELVDMESSLVLLIKGHKLDN